jgi:hypothetical protein
VATLTTLADARALIEQLPEDHHASPVWHHIMTQLEQSAAGIEVVDLGIAIRLALLLEGLVLLSQKVAAFADEESSIWQT